jgi:hypothetical protein
MGVYLIPERLGLLPPMSSHLGNPCFTLYLPVCSHLGAIDSILLKGVMLLIEDRRFWRSTVPNQTVLSVSENIS